MKKLVSFLLVCVLLLPMGAFAAEDSGTLSPSDFPLGENLSWGADFIDSPQLVRYIEENGFDREITVAVIDSGINTNHPLFRGRILPESRSFVSSEPQLEDTFGHGSLMSGIIVDNTPSNVKILALKALPNSGSGKDEDIAAAINFALEQDVDLINLSVNGSISTIKDVFRDAMKNAADRGIPVVCAAGNKEIDASKTFPASLPEVITVAASDKNGGIMALSDFGSCVDVAAPGVSIKSASKRKDGVSETYSTESGTSCSCAFVTAACADKLILNPEYSAEELKSFVTSNVTSYNSNSEKYYGTGIISLTNYIGESRTSPVVFDRLSGSYDEEFSVAMRADEGSRIYYTLDGSDPSESNGNLYREALRISRYTCVKALAYRDGFYHSKITKAVYDAQKPTEEPTQPPTQDSTQAPTRESTQAPAQTPTEMPSQAPTEPKPIPIGMCDISLKNSSAGYLGVELTLAPEVKMGENRLRRGVDYELRYSDNLNVGKAKIVVLGKGNFSGSAEVYFDIVPFDISVFTPSLSRGSFTYNGKPKTPLVSFPVPREGYELEYRDNVRAGVARVKIKGVGNYTGEVEKTFTIQKANQSPKLTVKNKSLSFKSLKKSPKKISPLKVKNFVGTLSFEKISVPKYFALNKKDGVITVRKGTKRGVYKLKVKVTVKATANYRVYVKNVGLRVVVK